MVPAMTLTVLSIDVATRFPRVVPVIRRVRTRRYCASGMPPFVSSRGEAYGVSRDAEVVTRSQSVVTLGGHTDRPAGNPSPIRT